MGEPGLAKARDAASSRLARWSSLADMPPTLWLLMGALVSLGLLGLYLA
jgi:hypothetical protein